MSDKDIFLIEPSTCTEHSFTDIARFDNGCSAWGTKICQKCGVEYDWQYDYGVSGHETKPY